MKKSDSAEKSLGPTPSLGGITPNLDTTMNDDKIKEVLTKKGSLPLSPQPISRLAGSENLFIKKKKDKKYVRDLVSSQKAVKL